MVFGVSFGALALIQKQIFQLFMCLSDLKF